MNFDQAQAATQLPANVTGVATPVIDKALSSGFNAPNYINAAQAANIPAYQSYNQGRADQAVKAKDTLQKAYDAVNGKNFQQIIKSDGGFDFVDPLGNKISPTQYASATNQFPIDVIKNSRNRLDQQAVSDYNNLDSIFQAAQKGSKALQTAVNSVYPDDQKKADALYKYIKDPSNDISTLYQQFEDQYPHLFRGYGYGNVRQPAGPQNFNL